MPRTQKPLFDQCYSELRERIRVRGYSGDKLHYYATRYAETHVALQKAEEELARAKRAHAALVDQIEDAFPIDAESRRQLSAELFCWLDEQSNLSSADRQSVLACVELLKAGKPVPFGAVDTCIRESIPDYLWDAITADDAA